jgi:uncharacterized protein YbjT (DUF2867 family)
MIIILGATGNVGSKIADILARKGERVRLVARSADRLRSRVGKLAEAFAGDARDTEFLVKAFKDAEAVFTMLPPGLDADKIGESIARALEIAKVNYVVNLSSVGADLSQGTGPIVYLHNQEERLNKIPGLNVLHIRPASFMENILRFRSHPVMNIDLITSRGINGSAVRGDFKLPMIATKDVASFAADRLMKRNFTGSSVRYLLGERDLSMIEATQIVGRQIGKPSLSYVMFPYDEALRMLTIAGLPPAIGSMYIELSRALNEGRINFEERSIQNTTPTSFEVFCDEVFVPVYLQRKAA